MQILWLALALLQQQGVVHGWVREQGSREPIPFASVEVVGQRAVLSDEHGYFVVTGVTAGPVEVRVRALGYDGADSTIVVPDGDRLRADFLLEPRPVALDAIRVRADAEEVAAAATAGPPPLRIDAPTIALAPGIAEKDAFRAIQLLPAVAAASDFSSALYIRGGSPDQNVVLLDGAPLFNPYHLGGLFSAIDPDAVATMEVLPGAIPAAEADRASGVIKVWTRDGGRDRLRGHGALGLVSSRLGVDGPLPGGDGTYLVSARRTYFDLLTKAAYRLGAIETPFPYSFTDAHAKITHDVGATGRLNVSGYINDERVHTPPEVEPYNRTSFAWGTRAGSVAYRQPFGGSLLAEFTLAATSFDGSFDALELEDAPGGGDPVVADTFFLGRITMRDIVARGGVTWYRGAHEIRAGLQLDLYDFEYDFDVEELDTGGGGIDEDAAGDIFATLGAAAGITTVAAYAEDEWSVHEGLAFRVGVRALDAEGLGTTVMPRVGLRWALADRFTFTAGAGRYAQAIHSLRNEESALSSVIPYELLVPASEESGFLVAEDVVAGLEYRVPNTRVRVDGYYKRYPSLPAAPLSADPLDSPIFATEFRPGTGWATGLELLAQHRQGRSMLMASYALTWAERTLEDNSYPPRFQRRHMIDLTGGLQFGGGGLLTARLAAGTGQPYTPALARFDGMRWDPETRTYQRYRNQVVLAEHNSERLPGYLRLDLGVRNESEHDWFGRTVTIVPYLQVLNVLGNRNVVTGRPSYNPQGGAVIEYFPALPTIPTLGVEWSF